MHERRSRPSTFYRHGYAWLVLALFVISAASHYVAGMVAFLGEKGTLDGYHIEWIRDATENYASEFLQLLLQIVGLAYLLYVGSPASKESSDRVEEKLDWLMAQIPGGEAKRAALDRRYMRGGGVQE